MTQTHARIITDSLSPNGVRLTTFVVTFHRFILAELNTHRAFSRNSASSRAIPSHKMIERVRKDIAYPVSYGSNQPGMQAGAELTGADLDAVIKEWQYTATSAADRVEYLNQKGLHKQVANRLLEPFLWHTAIITATDFDNFFYQRCHPDAQPEMKALADAMQLEYYQHTPYAVEYGEWHLPFIANGDYTAVLSEIGIEGTDNAENLEDIIVKTDNKLMEYIKRISAARCARVSYEQHDGTRSVVKDVELYDKLAAGSHWSPFEHIATPCKDAASAPCSGSGNFRGWHQFRKQFERENRTRFIPNLPDLTKQAEILKAGGKLW